mgnify:CR=1 FL=1|jgi:hypothetical protein
MDSGTKDSIANIASMSALSMTFADIQMWISLAVLVTALLLNISRLYDWFNKRRKK